MFAVSRCFIRVAKSIMRKLVFPIKNENGFVIIILSCSSLNVLSHVNSEKGCVFYMKHGKTKMPDNFIKITISRSAKSAQGQNSRNTKVVTLLFYSYISMYFITQRYLLVFCFY